MPASYTIEKARERKRIDTKFGEMVVYEVTLDDGNAAVDAEMLQKLSTPPPEIGSQVEGTIESGQYGMKFKKAQSFGRNGGSSDWQPEHVRDPFKAATIRRQHSQTVALMHIEGMERRAPADKPVQIESLETIKKIIQWFDDDAREAGEKALKGGESF